MGDTKVEDMVKVHASFDTNDDLYAGGPGGENFWATPLGGSRYRIENVPFVAHGFSFKDEVSAVDDGEYLEILGVVGDGGLGLVRAILTNGGLEELADVVEKRYPGCHIEGGFGALLVVALPYDKVEDLYAFLDNDPAVAAVEIAKAEAAF